MLYMFFDVTVLDGLQALHDPDKCHNDKNMYEAKLSPVYLADEDSGYSRDQHK